MIGELLTRPAQSGPPALWAEVALVLGNLFLTTLGARRDMAHAAAFDQRISAADTGMRGPTWVFPMHFRIAKTMAVAPPLLA